ncbi:hypothetical protein CHUAL_003797 [Chamberlinius hualienensis]
MLCLCGHSVSGADKQRGSEASPTQDLTPPEQKTCFAFQVYSSCDTPLFEQSSHESLDPEYSSPTHRAVQLRKSQSFPAGRTPIDDCYLHDYRHRTRLRLRPQTVEMDLYFITERIISVSFPMTGMDDSYRNSLQEVIKMLRNKHGENYMIFNLSDRRNDMSQLNHQLLEFGWPDPLAPPLERLCAICKAMDGWLSSDPQHVAVLHCKGGKERTAVVVAAFMNYSSICAISPDQALDRFAMKKFFNDKSGGLVTPSHKRLINYFHGLLSGAIEISNSPLFLHQIVFFGALNFDSQGGGCRLFVKVYQGLKPIYTSGVYTVSGNVRMVTISLDTPIQLRGDCLVKAYHRRTKPDGRDVIFRCQFHTCAISEQLLTFNKEDLDDACDDNRFPDDGRVEFKFSSSADRRYGGVRDLSVPVDYSSDAIVKANSYESLDLISDENPYDTAYTNPRYPVHHTIGPIDGNPYATVNKKKAQTNGFHNGGPTASMDSGISSATPPHSGQSSSSAGTGHINGTSTPITNGHSSFKANVDVHLGQPQKPINSDEQRMLDELLDGMMAQVETIPDLKPGTQIVKRVTYSPDTFIHSNENGHSNGVNGHSNVANGDADEAEDKEWPYHARKHSQPFTYLVPGSPSTPRKHRYINIPAIERRAKMNEENDLPLPPPPPPLDFTDDSNASEIEKASPPIVQTSPTTNGTSNKPQSYSHSHDSAYDSEPNSYRGMDGDKNSDKWLQRQQEKLRARQEAKVKQERYPKEKLLFTELRTAQAKLPKPQESSDDDDLLDLHLSETRVDHQKPLYVNTYTNGYDRQQNGSAAPIRSKKFGGPPQSPPPSGKPPPGRGGSAPSSPLIPSRSSSKDATRHAGSRFGTWQPSGPQGKPVARQRSDTSFDRERPFINIKKAHEFSQANIQKNAHKGAPNPELFAAISNSPIYQNVTSFTYAGDRLSPNSPTKTSVGLLTTVPKPTEDQPRTSSPISGHPEDLDFSVQSIGHSNWSANTSYQTDRPGSPSSSLGPERPTTPGFPVPSRTPYSDQDSGISPRSTTPSGKDRSPSPATVQQLRSGLALAADSRGHTDGGQSSPTVYYGQSRRSSLISLTEPAEVIHHHPLFVKDTSKFWYKPNISREDAINALKAKPPGTFLVRDSNSFPGAFGLALKVASPPSNVQNKSGDISNELVRHFLIEPTAKGVKLKGCSNEPVFGSLSALVYQHSITPLALPCKLILPEIDLLGADVVDNESYLAAQLLDQGAACSVLYLYTMDVESLTGPQAVLKTTSNLLTAKPLPDSTVVHFKVSSQGITITDSKRQLFFRRHYPVLNITHCGLDPDDRRWARSVEDSGIPVTSNRIFGVVARKPASKTDNQCHLFAELEPEQPATAIVNFVTKVLMSTSTSRSTVI